MSGGTLEYSRHSLEEVAGRLRRASSELAGGEGAGGVTAKIEEAIHNLERTLEMLERVDWLLSGDDSEETFLERWRAEVRPAWSPD